MTEQEQIRLLADESFINYSLGHNKEDIAYWENYLKENPWEVESLEELKTIIILTTQNIQDLESNGQLALVKKRIEAGEQSSEKLIKRPVIRSFRRWSIAASIVGVISMAGFTWNYFSKNLTTPVPQLLAFISKEGERKSFQLPDGSIVILNSGSRLVLGDNFNQKNRIVELNGEAYFDVAHDEGKPFTVKTNKMDVKVLGTAFNVKAYDNSEINETSLIRGTVELTLKEEKKKVILHPNQKFVLNNPVKEHSGSAATSSPSVKTVLVDGLQPVNIEKRYNSVAEISWTNNTLVFIDEPFEEVVKKLGRWYGVPIELSDPSLEGYSFTATFRNESIHDVLSGLQFSRHFEFIEENGKITIKK